MKLNSLCKVFLISGFILLNGCVSVAKDEPVLFDPLSSYFDDNVFPATAADFAVESAPDFLSLPARYKRELDDRVVPLESEYDRYKAVRRWAFDTFKDFEYVTTQTLSLSDLNTNRKYNCLTFASLFVAAARYVDVHAEFQLVFAPPYWDRANNSWINNQHINVSGSIRLPQYVEVDIPSDFSLEYFTKTTVRRHLNYTADINPAVVSMSSRRQILNEEQVLSLFYSNRSVEKLLGDDLAAAYAYTRAALEADAGSAVAWNNLGVLYNRVGESDKAQQAFELAIANDERAYSAMSNLARAHRDQGDLASALTLEQQIEEFRFRNPYYHAALAEQDFDSGDLEAAREHLLNALERKHNEHNFYHRLAVIAQQQHDYDAVLEYLDRARRFARGEDKARFAGKLEALREVL